MKKVGTLLRQHRTIWQEHSAKDFGPDESFENRGILGVFLVFKTARMGQKIGRRPQTQLCGVVLILLCFLSGCSGQSEELQQGLDLRGALLKASGCNFDATVTADYGDKLYTFVMTCQADSQGNLTFTVAEPKTLAGITGQIAGDGGKLTFDDTALYFPLMADDQITPVSAPWVFLKTLRGGCITSAGTEDGRVRLSIDDSYEDDAMHLDIWLDGQKLPQRAEIVYDGRRILSLEVSNFTIL